MKKSSFLVLGGLVWLAACSTPGQQSANAPPVGPDTLNVADAAIAGGDPNMALSVSQSVLQTNPNSVDALIHEGDAYYALNRCPAAIAAYTLALHGNPQSTAAETGMGRCLLKTDPKAAEAALEQAVHDDPGNAAALNDLGIARDLQGNFAGAVGPYQQALLAQPGMTAAEINLGLSLALSGNGPAALQYLGPMASGQSATPKIREDYAAALVASGRTGEARRVLAIDLPAGQVDQAINGFATIIAGGQAPLPPGSQPAAGPATATVSPPMNAQVKTAAVSAAPLPGSPAPIIAATATAKPPAALPAIDAPPADDAPADPNAAYVGPSPITGAVSSSTQLPGAAGAAPPPAPRAPAKMASAAAPASDPPAAVAAAGPPAANVPGAYQVQLGALASQPDAALAWNRVSSAMPALFADKSPQIEPASVNGKTFYRLRTGSFASKAAAQKFCGAVSATGNPCTVANF
jgi:Flp pilus assembly protein TadD